MLVRRFTIVCLLLTAFGISFSMLVAEASRPAGSWTNGVVVPCVFEQGQRCVPPARR